jgi:hypothetical protein
MSIAALVWVMLSSIEFDWSQLPVSKYHAEFEMVLPVTNFNMETAILQAASGCGWMCGPVINSTMQATTGTYRCFDQGGFEGVLGGRKLSDTIDISWKVDGRCVMFNVDSYEPTGYREPIIHRRDKKSVKMFQTKLEDIVNRMLTSKP